MLVACSGATPLEVRGSPPRQAEVRDAGSDQPGTAPDPATDNPSDALLTTIDGGTYKGGRKDVPFQCTPGVFCKRQERGQENCGTLTLTLDVRFQPVDILIVFDQSSSMGDAWGNTGQTKIQAAQTAITNAVTSLEDVLNVGAIFFPTYACGRFISPRKNGVVAPIDGTGQIPFQPASQFLQAWQQHWNQGTSLGVGTPLQEAFDRADQAIQAARAAGPMVVVAVTDGQPNCTADPMYTMVPTAAETDHSQQWSMNGIQTYVIGLPGASGAQLLDDIAINGGTSGYILPDDPRVLEAKLQQIVQTSVQTHTQACTIHLSPPAFQPVSQLELDLVETNGTTHNHVSRSMSSASGWTVSSDGSVVQFNGDLCNQILRAQYSAITFEYGCDHSTEPPSPQLN